jgi:hypothetical protein
MSQTIVPSTEKLVASGDGRLATQAFGDPSDPGVLLIKGQLASMLGVARTVLSTAGRSRPVRDPPRQPPHGAARPVMSPALLAAPEMPDWRAKWERLRQRCSRDAFVRRHTLRLPAIARAERLVAKRL